MCVEKRLENFFKESIFDTIRNEQPELFRKVHAVCVDYSAIDLGISAEDREILCDEVEVRILPIGMIYSYNSFLAIQKFFFFKIS